MADGRGLMVQVEDVHKSFGSAQVLKGINLSVRKGETIVIIGPSGSGKRTLQRTINHLEPRDKGRITVDGEMIGYRETNRGIKELPERQVARQREKVGMVFQRFNLFPHMTALGNVIEAPMRVKGLGKRQAIEQATGLLNKVGLGQKLSSLSA